MSQQPTPQPVRIERITKRADYLRIAKGRRAVRNTLVLQAKRQSSDEAADCARIGFTCSRKVGNAVARNRARRRLKEAARDVMSLNAKAGYDYVLIGRGGALDAPYEMLKRDLQKALAKAHAPRAGKHAKPSAAARTANHVEQKA